MKIPDLIEGQRIRLVPLSLDHAEDLYVSGNQSDIWTYLPERVEEFSDMIHLIENALSAKETGLEFPYAVFDKKLNTFIGSTRLLNISESNRNFEIGWTWYSPEVWRTRVNTECKYQLLKYGFEQFGAVRIQFKADVRNERSNKALARIGAIKEGTLRQDRILHDGFVRNACIYSIIDGEWPEIKRKLEEYLKQ